MSLAYAMGCGAAAHARSLARERLHGLRRRLPDRVPVPGTTRAWPSELAARLRISKQALNYLLGGLERLGYLERRADPDDLRSKRIILSKRGKAAVAVIRDAVAESERIWTEQLGDTRFAQLRALLVEINTAT